MERKNVIYGIILGPLVVALLVVGVLILRKRSEVGSMPVGVTESLLPPGTRTIESYKPERPWQEGDAPIQMEERQIIELPIETIIE
jgi:hypothetical protein